MSDSASNPQLLPSLGRLIRGLSILFWGVPVALLVSVQTVKGDAFRTLGMLPAVAVNAWLLYGVWQLGYFQRQERIWQRVLDRTMLLGWMNLGLAPFLYWQSHLPDETFFNQMLLLQLICGALFLCSLNVVLPRLTAMLPDQTLRAESASFSLLNRALLLAGLAIALGYLGLRQVPGLPINVLIGLMTVERLGLWLLLCFLLLPLAITMALLWKVKELLLDAVFGNDTAGVKDKQQE